MIKEEHKLGDMNQPPPPPGKKIGALPPPGTNKSTIGKPSKLERSPQMSNLYRLLRDKLENDAMTPGIVSSLKGWRFTAASAMTPISDQLNKIDSYFKQIEKKVNTIEMDKEKDANKFRSQNLTFDYNILTRTKEEMVDVLSNCIEIALKESKKTKEAGTTTTLGSRFCCTLWQVFQFAYKVYIFAGGQDDRANRLSDELACELQTYIQN